MMNAVFSIFPKFYRHLSAEQLAELVRQVGLDTTNLVVREGYWVDPQHLGRDVPKFVKAMDAAGVKVTFATAGFSADQIVFDPTPLKVFADNGITEFRMGYFRVEKDDVRTSCVVARHKLATMVDLCAEANVRAVYQVHHGTLFPSASAAFGLVNGLDPGALGVMLDPGNQQFEGYERWPLSVGLLGEYLRAVGVKDTAVWRDPARAGEGDKGWRRTWATLDEGETNWHDLIRALHRADFEGTFVWMPFYDQDDCDEMTRKLRGEVAYLRRVVADVEGQEKARAEEAAKAQPGDERPASS
jgi:sugar phosphate isomerase/epimerase